MQLPRPEVIEYSPDELPTEIQRLSAFAPLMSQLRRCALESARVGESCGAALAVAPAAPGVELAQLERFQRLMRQDGWSVQPARMCYDRLYARDRIALAHGSACRELRLLSLLLFRLYEEVPATPH